MRSMRLGVEAVEHRLHHVLAELGEAVEQRPRGRRQVQPLGAAVVRIGAALDQAVVGQPVEQPGQRDRLQVEDFGELGLLEALGAVEPQQHRPLRAGHAELARPLVGIGPQQAGYVHDCKGDFSFDWLRCGMTPYS